MVIRPTGVRKYSASLESVLTNPSTYLLEDYQGRPVKGGFYAQELQRDSYPDVYLVEKVWLRREGKSYVKWIGFSSEHNSWIE
jgi:hypothetical protein